VTEKRGRKRGLGHRIPRARSTPTACASRPDAAWRAEGVDRANS
jgi:hypothetical protein